MEIQRLYAILGTTAAVERAITSKQSVSSVEKYINREGVPRNIKIAVENLPSIYPQSK